MDIATYPVALLTPLEPGQVMLRTMKGSEALSELFCYELDVVTSDAVGASELLGQPISVRLEVGEQTYRYFNGLVTEMDLADVRGRTLLYRLVVRPAVWALTRNSNSRIFQDLSLVDIIKKVFRDVGYSDFEEKLSGDYAKQEFVVQYCESDFNFVSRMMERAGVYYYFTHTKDNHKLVLADSTSSHVKGVGCEKLPYYPPDEARDRFEEYVSQWTVAKTIQPGAAAATDFNFERPKAMLLSKVKAPEKYPFCEGEVFEYPGGFKQSSEGNAHVKLRLEQLKVAHDQSRGATNAKQLSVGNYFELCEHPSANGEYLVTSAHYRIRGHMLASAATPTEEPLYLCTFGALARTRPFRATGQGVQPRVLGPQTAIVVGQSGEEIYTDKYGRVKVQFHWDRYGKADEKSSCWVRVATSWAGTKWGNVHIPRIGQEVVVEFLDGDPDRPIIVGSVYNGDNMPPYELPTNKTQSGIKSQSSKGGSPNNYNEIRFEDKKGSEELHIQAEKDMTTLVKHDQTTTVKNNRTANISVDDATTVGGDQTIKVTGNLSITVKGQGKDLIKSNMDVTGKHKMHASDSIDMDAPTYIQLKVGGSSIMMTPASITLTAGGASITIAGSVAVAAASGGATIKVDPDVKIDSKNGGSMKVDKDVLVKSSAGQQMLLDASKAEIKAGSSTVELNATGIKVDSMQVTETGGGSKVELGPAGAKVSGMTVSVKGTTMTEISGMPVKIN